MSKLLKCSQYKEIFEVNQGKKQWIQNWDTYLYLGYKSVKDEVDIISLEDLKVYPVGDTKKVTTVTQIVKGKAPRELFYPDESEVTIRKMTILGTCLDGCVDMWKNKGGTHFYGNRFPWPHPESVEKAGMKIFINPHGQYGTSEAETKKMVLEWKDRPGCGGYWSDLAGGHEPDITGPNLESRIEFYNIVRKYDPDEQNHPVMEMMDMTLKFNGYPGWEDAFSDKTHDLLLFDCYPPADWTDEKMIEGMENAWKTMISVFPHTHQVIPQINACSYRKGTIWLQYNFWNDKMKSGEFDNPYKGNIALAFYKDEFVRKNGQMQEEIKAVNKEIMR